MSRLDAVDCLSAGGDKEERRMKKKEDMTDWLGRFEADTACAGMVRQVAEERGVALTENFRELLELLQVPVVYGSMLARLLEVKAIFRPEIKAFRKHSGG